MNIAILKNHTDISRLVSYIKRDVAFTRNASLIGTTLYQKKIRSLSPIICWTSTLRRQDWTDVIVLNARLHYAQSTTRHILPRKVTSSLSLLHQLLQTWWRHVTSSSKWYSTIEKTSQVFKTLKIHQKMQTIRQMT